MKLTIILCLFVLLGSVIHYLSKIWDAKTKHEKFNYNKQLLKSAINIPFLLLLVYFRTQLAAFQPTILSPEIVNNFIFWILIGYAGDSVIKNLRKSQRTMLNDPSDRV